MFAKNAQLQGLGVKGRIMILLRILLCGFPIAIVFFTIYWAIISSEGMWLSINGPTLLILNVIVMLLAVGSFVVMLFAVIGILASAAKPLLYTYIGVTCAAFLVGFILLGFGTEQKLHTYFENVNGYCTSPAAAAYGLGAYRDEYAWQDALILASDSMMPSETDPTQEESLTFATESFSATQSFTATQPFSATQSFTQTQPFTATQSFTATQPFSATSPFTAAVPMPTETPGPTPSPSQTPGPTASPSATPAPTATASPTATAMATASPLASASPSPSMTPGPTASHTATMTPVPTPTIFIDPNLTYYQFCSSHWTDWSKKRYVRSRTTDAYEGFAGLLAPWIALFIVFLVMVFFVLEGSGGNDSERGGGYATPKRRNSDKVTVETPLISPGGDELNIFRDEPRDHYYSEDYSA